MTDEDVNEDGPIEIEDVAELQEAPVGPSELDLLKQRARQIGLDFHHRVGAKKLKQQIKDYLNKKEITKPVTTTSPKYGPGIRANETKAQRKIRIRNEAHKLIRIRVTCMNPAMKEYEGQIYSAGNSVVGMKTEYVPFNVDDGWHVPNILYHSMREKQCQVFYTTKGPRGQKLRKGKLINELSIEVLPDLTTAEMKELARKQAMAANQSDQ